MGTVGWINLHLIDASIRVKVRHENRPHASMLHPYKNILSINQNAPSMNIRMDPYW
jgi:hypothetical protein